MTRRGFIALVGCTVVAWPLAARAQEPTSSVVQPKRPVPHVGILNYAGDEDIRARQFRTAIAGLGYIEGENLTLSLRSAEGVFDRLPGRANSLRPSSCNRHSFTVRLRMVSLLKGVGTQHYLVFR